MDEFSDIKDGIGNNANKEENIEILKTRKLEDLKVIEKVRLINKITLKLTGNIEEIEEIKEDLDNRYKQFFEHHSKENEKHFSIEEKLKNLGLDVDRYSEEEKFSLYLFCWFVTTNNIYVLETDNNNKVLKNNRQNSGNKNEMYSNRYLFNHLKKEDINLFTLFREIVIFGDIFLKFLDENEVYNDSMNIEIFEKFNNFYKTMGNIDEYFDSVNSLFIDLKQFSLIEEIKMFLLFSNFINKYDKRYITSMNNYLKKIILANNHLSEIDGRMLDFFNTIDFVYKLFEMIEINKNYYYENNKIQEFTIKSNNYDLLKNCKKAIEELSKSSIFLDFAYLVGKKSKKFELNNYKKILDAIIEDQEKGTEINYQIDKKDTRLHLDINKDTIEKIKKDSLIQLIVPTHIIQNNYRSLRDIKKQAIKIYDLLKELTCFSPFLSLYRINYYDIRIMYYALYVKKYPNSSTLIETPLKKLKGKNKLVLGQYDSFWLKEIYFYSFMKLSNNNGVKRYNKSVIRREEMLNILIEMLDN